MAQEEIKTCQGCGASIYQEHLDRGTAGFWAGQLLCTICLAERGHGKPPAPRPPAPESPDDLSSISLVEEEPPAGGGETRKFAGTDSLSSPALQDETKYQRPLIKGAGATRCRTFHAKLTDGAIAFLNEQINEWCDNNPEIEVKFCTSAIGMFEGKQHQEPNLILTVFY